LSGPTILEVVGKVERSNLALIDDGATVIEDDDVVARIDHPNGIRAVCNEHVDDYTVVEEVA